MRLNPQNYQLPANKTAYVFSDAAGANACIAMFELNKRIPNRPQLFSNRSHFSEHYNSLIQRSRPELQKSDFDCIFLGTSHPSSSDYFELNCLKQAKQKNIHTISFVDHWTNFKLRFTDAVGETVFPNEVWVIDEKAKQLAIGEGLPAEIIKITGNPYHHYLKNQWTSSWKGKSYFSALNIKPDAFHIVFAPDPLSLRNKKEKVGFSEEEALRDILKLIADFNDEHISLVVKCHPLQPEEILEKEINKCRLPNVFLIKTANPLELISASDLVIGFYSNFLLDAKALGKNVIRYYPGNDEADLLSHDESVLKIKEKTSLHHHLKSIIYG